MIFVEKEYLPARSSFGLASGKENRSKKQNVVNSAGELQNNKSFTQSCRMRVDVVSYRERAFP
jgi:hypothetical protein